MKRCNHKWVDLEDGSLDKFCIRCCLRAKQATAAFPLSESKVEMNVNQFGIKDELTEWLAERHKEWIVGVDVAIVNGSGTGKPVGLLGSIKGASPHPRD